MTKKEKKKKSKNERKKIHTLVGVSADPCTYISSDKFVSSSLVGVEVELEGVQDLLIEDSVFKSYWDTIEDGSLRDGGMEYVLSRPFAGIDLDKALSLFDEHVSKSGHNIKVNKRTSVHIHIDVRDLTYKEVTKFVCLYIIFEDALFNVAGKDRKDNIFSTSLDNASGNLSKMNSFGDDPDPAEVHHILRSFTKYSACNLAAIQKYGSLEFRNHEGTYDVERITLWINLLLSLKKAAVEIQLPTAEIFSSISTEGTSSFLKSVFGEMSSLLEYNDLEYGIYNGLRLAQDIVYHQQLEDSIELPTVEDPKETSFAVYYKKRKPKRFEERFEIFMENGGTPFSLSRGNLNRLMADVEARERGIQWEDDVGIPLQPALFEVDVENPLEIIEIGEE